MSDELDSADFHAVIGYYNIGSLDRQQEIWDRLTNHMFAAFSHKAGLGEIQASTPDLSPTSKKHCSSLKKKIHTIPTRRMTMLSDSELLRRRFWTGRPQKECVYERLTAVGTVYSVPGLDSRTHRIKVGATDTGTGLTRERWLLPLFWMCP
jgi:hypothetical protein